MDSHAAAAAFQTCRRLPMQLHRAVRPLLEDGHWRGKQQGAWLLLHKSRALRQGTPSGNGVWTVTVCA
jgi:hypothetical protein